MRRHSATSCDSAARASSNSREATTCAGKKTATVASGNFDIGQSVAGVATRVSANRLIANYVIANYVIANYVIANYVIANYVIANYVIANRESDRTNGC